MQRITSNTNAFIKEKSMLKNKKVRDELSEFLVEGYHLVEEAYKADVLKMVFITDEKDEIQGVENILVTSNIIEKLSSTKTPQQIVGVCRIPEKQEILGERFVILDGVQDPGNLGTIIRSAMAFDIDQIIISEDTVDPFNEKVIRATQGGIFSLPIIRLPLDKAIDCLKEKEVVIYGTDLQGTPLNKNEIKNKYAIVLGNEGNGVSSNIKAICDQNILIEMNPKMESLNVGVAGSILMYQFYINLQ